jgi:hypothetical protein
MLACKNIERKEKRKEIKKSLRKQGRKIRRGRKERKRKNFHVLGRGGRYGCETSRLTHLLDNWLRDGGEVVSLTRRPPFTPRKIPGTHLC